MKNIKNIVKGIALLSLFVGALVVTAAPASADNNGNNSLFLNANASLKAEALIRLESTIGVVLGANGEVKVMNAKVTSVSDNEINATATFGNSSLSFVVKVDEDTKINNRSSSSIDSLKVGDKVSFGGKITSSTSSSLVIDADHVVSRALLDVAKKTNFQGDVKAVNTSDNSFTLKLKERTIKVSVNSSTVITIDGATKTLADLKEGDEVKVSGEINTDASVITATKVKVESDDGDDDDNEENDKNKEDGIEKKNDKSENKGWFNRFRSWFW